MNVERRNLINNNLKLKDTEELLAIWRDHDDSSWQPEVFEIIEAILLERLGSIPPLAIESINPVNPGSSDAEAEEILKHVDNLLEADDLDQAHAACEQALKVNPELAAAYYYRGMIYDEMGRFNQAIADFQEAVRLDPKLGEAWEYLLRMESEIKEQFENSIAMERIRQAVQNINHDQLEQALDQCNAARQLLPPIAYAFNLLGSLYQELGQLEPAIAMYVGAVRLNPRYSPARRNLRNARLELEANQYRYQSKDGLYQDTTEFQLVQGEADDLESSLNANLVPGWLYLDERAFELAGWPGHRLLPGRSGYDPLDSYFELAHIGGALLNSLLTGRKITTNPIYLLVMAFYGLTAIFPVVGIFDAVIQGQLKIFSAAIGLIIFSPILVLGGALLINVWFGIEDLFRTDR